MLWTGSRYVDDWCPCGADMVLCGECGEPFCSDTTNTVVWDGVEVELCKCCYEKEKEDE